MNFIARIFGKKDSRLFLPVDNSEVLVVLLNNARVHVGKHADISENCIFSLSKNVKNVRIGDDVALRKGCNFIAGDDANLEIGNDVFIQEYCMIHCRDHITIGAGSLLRKGVKICDHNGDLRFTIDHIVAGLGYQQAIDTAPVIIGTNCWIGSNTVILKGVTIGNNVIIDDHCIINHDIADNCTIVNPNILKNMPGKGMHDQITPFIITKQRPGL
jgi:acetyltransferase-like isoleucine patch superfamily enzyme